MAGMYRLYPTHLAFAAVAPGLKLPLVQLAVNGIVLDELLPVLGHDLGIVAASAQGVAGHAGKLLPSGRDAGFSTAHSLRLRTVCDVYAIVHPKLIAEPDSRIVLAP